MNERVAVISIIVENEDAVDTLNALLHEYGKRIIGRLGLPYRQKNVNIICVAIDAPTDEIHALTGELRGVAGIHAKATYSNV